MCSLSTRSPLLWRFLPISTPDAPPLPEYLYLVRGVYSNTDLDLSKYTIDNGNPGIRIYREADCASNRVMSAGSA